MIVKNTRDDFQDYLIDASNMTGGTAESLFIPETKEELADILRRANENGVSITISGARTGTVGGAIPFGGYVVSLERFNKIIEIGEDFATVEAGVILADFQRETEAKKLLYPPDPTEWSCQIGGTVATNASGARSFKYGSTRNFVRRLEVVLADGEFLTLNRGEIFAKNGKITLKTNSGKEIVSKIPTYDQPNVRKNTSGYFSSENLDAIDLFIGSEGTLGVIYEIELAILKQPESFFSGIIFFNDERNLLDFVNESRKLSFENRKEGKHDAFNATFIEYFDENALKFISEKFPEVPSDAKGAIFFEQECNTLNEDTLLLQWNELLERNDANLEQSWFTTTDQDRQKMKDFRHALPVSVNEWIVRHKQRKVGTDMAVPDEHFEHILNFYRTKLAEYALEYVIFGHIGDNHLHVNILPKNGEEMTKAKYAYGRFIAQALMLDGTISAEHGIGKLKKHYLYTMMGERYLNEIAEIKKAFDPKGILGRGNLLDEKFLQ
jgi:D-lactate dehydrogenase (cytochrome)